MFYFVFYFKLKLFKIPVIDCKSTDGKIIDKPKGKIVFEKVKFTYPTRLNKLILDELSWHAEPGQSIALVGHSGSGKSTSVSMKFKFFLLN